MGPLKDRCSHIQILSNSLWILEIVRISRGVLYFRVLFKQTANLSNSSTRRKFAIFVEFEYSPKWPFLEMCRTRQTRRHSPSRVARTRQTRKRRVWQVLCKFSESGKFGKCRLDRFMHIKYL
jgi:hypothetical protein